MRNTWQKPVNAKAPIPLQSKNGYPPTNIHRQAPYPPPYAQEHSPEYPAHPPMPQSHHPPPDGDRIKPILVDEDRDQYGRGSPSNVQPKPAWMKNQPRPYSSNPPYFSKYHPEADQRGSSHDGPYSESHESGSMQPPARVHRSNSSHSQYSGQSSQAHSQSNAQTVAQNALSQHTSLRPSPAPSRRDTQLTEREKMLKGIITIRSALL